MKPETKDEERKFKEEAFARIRRDLRKAYERSYSKIKRGLFLRRSQKLRRRCWSSRLSFQSKS